MLAQKQPQFFKNHEALTTSQILFFKNEAVILWEKLINKYDSQYYAEVITAGELEIPCPIIESESKIVFICFLLVKRSRDDTIEPRRGRYYVVSKNGNYSAFLCTQKELTLTIDNLPWQAQYQGVPE